MIRSMTYVKKHFLNYGFSPYSAAYVVTNENLRNALDCIPKDAKKALTVAASGDHPMFTALRGVKNVDTFDISFNARLIMDIKTNALSLLEHKEYCQLLKDIHCSKDIMSVKNIPQIIQKLNPFEQKYITEMHKYYLFSRESIINPFSLPTATEFSQMQQIINKPFKFIWSDIKSLHKQLKKSYDFIHLSNIFDYLSIPESVNILHKLMKRTNPNGVICFTELVSTTPDKMRQYCEQLKEIVNTDTQSWDFHRKTLCLYTLHRVK